MCSAYINSQSPDIFRPILSGQTQLDLTHLLYIINEKIIHKRQSYVRTHFKPYHKCQACCIANTVQWLKIYYSYFNYGLCKQFSLMIHAHL